MLSEYELVIQENDIMKDEIKSLEAKLQVAVEALEHCAKYSVMDNTGIAKIALEKIKAK